MTLIHLNDPNLTCSLTLVLVRQKGQNSLVLIAGGNRGINIWTFCNFLAYNRSGRYDTCFPRRFFLHCCQNVLIKCIPGERGRKGCLVWAKRRAMRFTSQRNRCQCVFQQQGLLGTFSSSVCLLRLLAGPTAAHHPDPKSLKKSGTAEMD